MNSLTDELAVLLRHGAGRHGARPDGQSDDPVVLADRDGGTVVRLGNRVAKAHDTAADPGDLAARLRAAAHPRFAGVLLAPLELPGGSAGFDVPAAGRRASLWPWGEPVSPEAPEDAPWEEAASLLARLHRVPPATLPFRLPAMRGPLKAARALSRLRDAGPVVRASARTAVERAWAGLPRWARGEAPLPRPDAVCHGDVHLGQLVRYPSPSGPWLLIDVDDLGLGDPAWDLARPAAWYATGLLAPDVWARFLGAYRAAGGPAVTPDGDPWARLDVPARALTVQSAALALAKAAAEGREPDDVDQALVDACTRMATEVTLPSEPVHDAP